MKKYLFLLICLFPTVSFAQWNSIAIFNNTFEPILAAPSDSNIFFTAESKYIRYSHNGGNSWNQFETEYDYEFFEDIDFVNDSVGFICGGGWFSQHRNLILRTKNAGQSWETLTRDSLGAFQFILSHIDFVNIDSGIVVDGYSYEMFRTFDGGQNWQQIYIDSNSVNPVSAIQFINSSVGYLATASSNANAVKAKIFKTVDFGTTWQVVYEWDYANDFKSIHFIDQNTGYLGGTNGKIFKTTDGGNSWTEMNTAPGNPVSAIYFSDAQTGYSNAFGTICKSTDGGISWNNQLMNPTNIVSNIAFSPSGNSGFLTAGNYVYKTTNGGGTTSIRNSKLQTELTIFPIPANSEINIDYPNFINAQSIQLTDVSGKILKIFNPKSKQLNISNMASGNYILLIETNEGMVSKKVIIE